MGLEGGEISQTIRLRGGKDRVGAEWDQTPPATQQGKNTVFVKEKPKGIHKVRN